MIYECVKRELEAAQVDSDILISTILERFLPQLDTPEQHLDILQRFNTKPITVSDRELSQIFRIKESTAKSSPSPGSICYFRSWQLPKIVLQAIIDSIRHDGIDFGPLDAWVLQMSDLDDSDYVFIRYIGQTMAPSTPSTRFNTATKVNRTSPIEVFTEKLEKIGGSYYKFHIYELCDTVTEALPMLSRSPRFNTETIHEELIDAYECAAISLFGSSSLLNKAPGGRLARFVPGRSELSILDSINPSVIHKITQLHFTALSSQAQDLALLSMDMRLWVKQNIGLLRLNNDKLQKLDTHISTHYGPQAACQLVNGHCLLSIIGAVVPDTSLEENTGFFTGSSHSSRSVVNAIQTLTDFESSFASGDLKSILALTSFTNFFNWPHKRYGRDQAKAMEILLRYLCLVQPLIVSNLGGGVLEMFSEYQTCSLTECVGMARLICVAGRQQPIYMISLPHFHPGYDAYASRPLAYHRLRFLCWVSVWTHMDVALTYLAKHDGSPGHHRQSLCLTIMNQAKIKLEQAGYYSTLALLKQEVTSYSEAQAKIGRSIDDKTHRKQKREMPESSATLRAEIATEKEFLESTLKLGVVYGSGAEGTRKRAQKMKHSWRVHKDYLCEALKISEEDQYRVFYETQPQDYYLRACIEASKNPGLVPHELRTVVDRWYAKNCKTAHTTGSLCVTERRDVYQKFAQDVMWRQARFSDKKLGRCPELQMSEIQNFDVGTKFGPFTVNVVSRTGEKRRITTSEFQKQAFKKRTYLDRRVLHIHADGIDVKDELGDTIYLDEANKTATIQQDNFSKFKDGKQLEWLWQEAR